MHVAALSTRAKEQKLRHLPMANGPANGFHKQGHCSAIKKKAALTCHSRKALEALCLLRKAIRSGEKFRKGGSRDRKRTMAARGKVGREWRGTADN